MNGINHGELQDFARGTLDHIAAKDTGILTVAGLLTFSPTNLETNFWMRVGKEHMNTREVSIQGRQDLHQ